MMTVMLTDLKWQYPTLVVWQKIQFINYLKPVMFIRLRTVSEYRKTFYGLWMMVVEMLFA